MNSILIPSSLDAYFDRIGGTCPPVHETKHLQGYLPRPVCLEWYQTLFQNPEFVGCFGVRFEDDKLKRILAGDVTTWDQRGFGPLLWFDKATHHFVGRGG